MRMLSDDDLNLHALNDDELARAWDLWFNLAQATNASDPAYTHGVFEATSNRSRALRSRTPEVMQREWRRESKMVASRSQTGCTEALVDVDHRPW